jgi:hypothetical protein
VAHCGKLQVWLAGGIRAGRHSPEVRDQGEGAGGAPDPQHRGVKRLLLHCSDCDAVLGTENFRPGAGVLRRRG